MSTRPTPDELASELADVRASLARTTERLEQAWTALSDQRAAPPRRAERSRWRRVWRRRPAHPKLEIGPASGGFFTLLPFGSLSLNERHERALPLDARCVVCVPSVGDVLREAMDRPDAELARLRVTDLPVLAIGPVPDDGAKFAQAKDLARAADLGGFFVRTQNSRSVFLVVLPEAVAGHVVTTNRSTKRSWQAEVIDFPSARADGIA